MKKFYVYVIESEEGYFYTGCTSDVKTRLSRHNDKTLSRWTKRGNSWRLIYMETYTDYSQALKREKWLKSGVGREYLKRKLKDKVQK